MSHPVERAWATDGVAVRLLAPLAWAFGAVTALRNLAFDRGVLRARSLGMPAISVGNLSVGGTGKTPVAAWVAQRLLARGLPTAILLRGYGADEPLVHAELTPQAIVVADPDRARGAAIARSRGARVAVLDDAFQHRQARRDADLVLLAAERVGSQRLLPAGPFRELPRALRRAHAVIVTRKSADRATAEQVLTEALRWAPGAAGAVVALRPGALRRVGTEAVPEERSLDDLRGARVLAVSAIGAPAAYEAQLAAAGASVVPAAYGDHHAFSAADVATLVRRAEGCALVVCTLKDAVKLAPLWPRQGPALWYLSQTVVVERGAEALDALLSRAVAAAVP